MASAPTACPNTHAGTGESFRLHEKRDRVPLTEHLNLDLFARVPARGVDIVYFTNKPTGYNVGMIRHPQPAAREFLHGGI
jgi:hypothetical protein